ncbi:MAG: PD40 domain-containing protein [Anaerolineae bacterium]|nr:PD40 domain-containing protein [Anaerolineae bacterium]
MWRTIKYSLLITKFILWFLLLSACTSEVGQPITRDHQIVYEGGKYGTRHIMTLKLDGTDRLILASPSVSTMLTTWYGAEEDPVWSPDGTRIAYVSQLENYNYEIYVMNADGTGKTRLTNNPALDLYPAWSSDGTQIVFASDRDERHDIYVMNSNGHNVRRLTNWDRASSTPAWSPDGTKIVFMAEEGNSYIRAQLFVMNADGTDVKQLTYNPGNSSTPVWSPDGSRIAYTYNNDWNFEIMVMAADGSRQANITQHPAWDTDPAWSPDGAKIVFTSTRADTDYHLDEIYIMNADGSNPTRLTYTTEMGESHPSWRWPTDYPWRPRPGPQWGASIIVLLLAGVILAGNVACHLYVARLLAQMQAVTSATRCIILNPGVFVRGWRQSKLVGITDIMLFWSVLLALLLFLGCGLLAVFIINTVLRSGW